ncbi:MAG: acyl-CoA thioesterase [Synechococcaceae cyanobacterium SM2_3_1]|nr:acyl-CoA thioesterase [Synechococcaceae cyanobacterium SM2_3_1]
MKTIKVDLEIYTYHIDFAGHVSNIVYIQWMEIARLKLLEALQIPTHMIAQQGITPVLTHTSINYKHPLYLGDSVQIELWLTELRLVSATMKMHFFKDRQTLVAEGIQKGLFIDITTKRAKRLTLEQRDLFLPYLHEAA